MKMRYLASMFMCSLLLAGIARADVYISGHADLGVGFENNGLHLHIHAEGPLNLFGGGTRAPGEIDPGDLMIGVPNPSSSRPAGAEWNFLAPSAGAPIWFLPQSNLPNKPFLGLGTEELVTAEWANPLTWRFNSITTVSGQSSHFAMWQDASLNTPLTVFASSLIPTANNNSWTQAAFSHNHFNYGFTGDGVYDVSFTISGVKTGGAGQGQHSDTAIFRFVTGNSIATVPEPSSLMFAGWLLVGSVLYRRRTA